MTAVQTRGIDVSHYQGNVNWADKRRRQGISFGMAKCVEGVTYFDSKYVANREACHLAGLPFIAYCYARPEASTPLAQARNLVEKSLTKGGTVEGYCLDLEISQLGQSATSAWKDAFGDNIRALAPDAVSIVYLGGYAANGSGQNASHHFDGWMFPHYLMRAWPTLFTPKVGANTTGFAQPTIWQCSDDIDGTDADVSILTVPQLFSGADMPISAADVQTLVNTKCIPSKRIDPATGKPSGELLSIAAYLASIDVNLVAANPDFAKDIAEAVVAALPPSAGGAPPTADEIAAAVANVFASKLGATS